MQKVKVTEMSAQDLMSNRAKHNEKQRFTRVLQEKEHEREHAKVEQERRRAELIRYADEVDRLFVRILGNACADCHCTFGYGVYAVVDKGTARQFNKAPYWNQHKSVSDAVEDAELLCPNCLAIRHWQVQNPRYLELLK